MGKLVDQCQTHCDFLAGLSAGGNRLTHFRPPTIERLDGTSPVILTAEKRNVVRTESVARQEISQEFLGLQRFGDENRLREAAAWRHRTSRNTGPSAKQSLRCRGLFPQGSSSTRTVSPHDQRTARQGTPGPGGEVSAEGHPRVGDGVRTPGPE